MTDPTPPTRGPSRAGEAKGLLETLVGHSRAALTALRDERWDDLDALLRKRDALIPRLEPLLERARLDAVPGAAAQGPHRAELLLSMLALQAADRALEAELGSGRAAVGAELDSLQQRALESRGYRSEPASAGRRLDLIK